MLPLIPARAREVREVGATSSRGRIIIAIRECPYPESLVDRTVDTSEGNTALRAGEPAMGLAVGDDVGVAVVDTDHAPVLLPALDPDGQASVALLTTSLPVSGVPVIREDPIVDPSAAALHILVVAGPSTIPLG